MLGVREWACATGTLTHRLPAKSLHQLASICLISCYTMHNAYNPPVSSLLPPPAPAPPDGLDSPTQRSAPRQAPRYRGGWVALLQCQGGLPSLRRPASAKKTNNGGRGQEHTDPNQSHRCPMDSNALYCPCEVTGAVHRPNGFLALLDSWQTAAKVTDNMEDRTDLRKGF